MPRLVKERIKKLCEEIAEISKENVLRGRAKKNTPADSEQQRRVQRLQEILDEVLSRTTGKSLDGFATKVGSSRDQVPSHFCFRIDNCGLTSPIRGHLFAQPTQDQML